MSLSASTQWEVRTGGNDTNGGGFVNGATGTDYSQTNSKRTATGTDDSTTDAVGNGTTTLTSATANFGTTIVGNIISLSGGSGSLTQVWRQVVSRTNATTIVLDASVAAGTGITMNIGGAIATPGGMGKINAQFVAGMVVWFQAGTYSITSASTNVVNGTFFTNQAIHVEGYNTVRGDLGTPPLIQVSGAISGFTMMTGTGVTSFMNLKLDGASKTGVIGLTARGTAYKVEVVNCPNLGFNTSTDCNYILCKASGNGTGYELSSNSHLFGCIANANVGKGFNFSVGCTFTDCISYANSGANGYGFIGGGESVYLSNCVAYGNSKDGFNTSVAGNTYINCISEANTENGYENVNVQAIYVNCAAFNNTAGDYNLGTSQQLRNFGAITGSASYFTTPGSGDFSLNTTSGGGAVARAAGILGIFPGGLTTGYQDLGAAQHQDAGGGSTEHSAVF